MKFALFAFASLALSLAFPTSGLSLEINVSPTAGDCAPGCPDSSVCSIDCTACAVAPAGPCPLQQALNIAACNGEDDTLLIESGTYDASAIQGDCGDGFCYAALCSGETAALNLQGAGADQTFIDASGLADVRGLDISATDAELTVSGLTFRNANAGAGSSGNGLSITGGNNRTVVEECAFTNNASNLSALYFNTEGDDSLTFNRNLFADNQTFDNSGGALTVVLLTGELVLTNNIFLRNQASSLDGGGDGGAIWLAPGSATVTIVNNSVTENSADAAGGGLAFSICNSDGPVELYNNIVYGNSSAQGGDDIFFEISNCFEDTLTVDLFNNDYSDLGCDQEGNPCSIGLNEDASNIDADPLFVDPSNDDLNLSPNSPALETGNPNPPGGLPNPDFAGNPRPGIPGTNPDMGALENILASPIPSPSASATPLPPGPLPLLSGTGCSLGGDAGSSGWLLFALPSLGVIFSRRNKAPRK